jgi:hypothetical protein
MVAIRGKRISLKSFSTQTVRSSPEVLRRVIARLGHALAWRGSLTYPTGT